jgi:hypothetical protein
VVSVDFLSSVTFDTIVVSGFHIIVIVQTLSLHELSGFGFPHQVRGEWSAAMITSPNDNAIDTTAGTNASPRNSDILKLPSLSASQNALSHRTYFIVKSGENIA